MAAALKDRLERLGAELAPRAAATSLALRGPAPPAALALPPAAAAWAEAALRALAEAALQRARPSGGGGSLELALGVVGRAGEGRLRALALDTLPGLPEPEQAAAFAFLAGEAPPPASDPLRLAALRSESGLAELDFASAAGGSLLWTELAQAAAASAADLPGWSRRPRLDASDLLRRLGGDRRIAQLVVATFRADAPLQLAALATALAGRPEEALRLAHSLKGAARNVGGLMLGEVAAAVEAALQEGRLGQAGAGLPRLRWELAQLEAAWVFAPA